LLGRGVRGIGKSCDMARSRNQLRQQFQPLAVEFGREDAVTAARLYAEKDGIKPPM
jgi:hypothetical protein